MSKRTSKRLRAPLPHFVVVLGLTALIFPVAAAWIWGEGWIAQRGFYDFAGSVVVHLPSGICALMASLVIGPRVNRQWGSPPPSRIVRTALLGIGLTVCGLLVYQPAAMLALLTENGQLGKLLVNGAAASLFGAGASGLTGMVFIGEWRWDAALKGALTGLAAVAAGGIWLNGLSAAIIGTGAGVAARAVIGAFEVLRIDDRLNTFAIHGVGGVIGALAAGLFLTGAPSGSGILTGGDSSVLFNQFIGTVAIAFGSGVVSIAILFALDTAGWLRWSEYAVARQAARQAQLAENAQPQEAGN
jgi:Amt family ammonium transporter